MPALGRDGFLVRIQRGDAVKSHRGNTHELEGNRHGIGGKLSATGPCSRARTTLEIVQFGIRHGAASMSPHRLEYFLNRDVPALELAGHNGTPVEHQRWKIEPGQGHDRTGNGFITAGDGHHGVKQMTADHQFDGIGHDFTADQGGFHALRAHADTVRYDDAIKFEGDPTGLADTRFNLFGKITQMQIAWGDLGPGIRDGDERFGEILIPKPHGP